MTIHRFSKVLRPTIKVFWTQAFLQLSPQERHYLQKTPTVRRNLDRRLLLALAETLLTPEQITRFKDTEIEQLQTELKDLSP